MAMMDTLLGCKLFHGVDAGEMRMFQALCRQAGAGQGSTVFRMGDPARSIYVVETGQVVLEMPVSRPDGGITRPSWVSVLGPGEAFGLSALVPPHVLTLTARAMEPSSLLSMDGAALRALLEEHREAGFRVMRNLAELLNGRLTATREALVFERGWALVG